MKIGTVIYDKSGAYIVTEINNGNIVKSPLTEYFSKVTMIKYGDEFKSLFEVIEMKINEYLVNSNCDIIEEED